MVPNAGDTAGTLLPRCDTKPRYPQVTAPVPGVPKCSSIAGAGGSAPYCPTSSVGQQQDPRAGPRAPDTKPLPLLPLDSMGRGTICKTAGKTRTRKREHFLNTACIGTSPPKFTVNTDKSRCRRLFPILENNPQDRGCLRHAERRLGLGEQLLRKVEVVFNFKKPMTTAFRSKEAFSQKVFCLGKNINQSG